MEFFMLVLMPIVAIGVLIFMALFLRRVVPTNEVHIVQTGKQTISYGKDTQNGNVYWEWPTWIPIIGVTKVVLPVSVFACDLDGYEAYDKGRLPFMVDIKAFFRITDSNLAAQRVSSIEQLDEQLSAIVQGAVRTILASSEIEEIMQGRSKFGELFTNEVQEQLKAWGVAPVKNIELMDIRDAKSSNVIANIMEKKKSMIEMESRTAVAENLRKAQVAEIEAKRDVDLQSQQAQEQVGIRTADKDKAVGIANELASQEVKEQERVTKEKAMAILQVEHVRAAEIKKNVNLIKADEEKQTQVINADGERQKTVLIAEGKLEEARRAAEGIKVEGEAKALAEREMQRAPVVAQIELAKEIGNNKGYQEYLINLRMVEKDQAVGVEQAKALHKADIKVIANTGSGQNAAAGLDSVMDLFSAKGGTNVAGMLEGLAQSEQGKALIDKFLPKK